MSTNIIIIGVVISAVIGSLFLFALIMVVSACMLSSQISQEEEEK